MMDQDCENDTNEKIEKKKLTKKEKLKRYISALLIVSTLLTGSSIIITRKNNNKTHNYNKSSEYVNELVKRIEKQQKKEELIKNIANWLDEIKQYFYTEDETYDYESNEYTYNNSINEELTSSNVYSDDYITDLIIRLEESGAIEKNEGSISDTKEEFTYKPVDLDDPRLEEFLSENNLYKISDYKDEMQEIVDNLDIAPEYSYEIRSGKDPWDPGYSNNSVIIQYNPALKIVMPMPYKNNPSHLFDKEEHGYTTDPNHEGIESMKTIRIPHYSFYGYQILERSDGKFVTIHSGYYNSIDEIPEDYQFVHKEFYRKDNYYIYLFGLDAEKYLEYYHNNDLDNDKVKRLIRNGHKSYN